MTKTNYIRSMAIEIAQALHALQTNSITPLQYHMTICDISARFEPTDNAWNNACSLADLMIQRGEV